MTDLSKKLQAYFKPDELEWRIAMSGKSGDRIWAQLLVYVTSRAVMNRMDEVFGPDNWSSNIKYGPDSQVLCELSAFIDGKWVTKTDGADQTDIEAVKGGISGAVKRAAVQWGIGRYLYLFGNTYAIVHDKGRHKAKLKDGTWFHYDIPDVDPKFMPGQEPWITGVEVSTDTGSDDYDESPAPPRTQPAARTQSAPRGQSRRPGGPR